MARPATSTTTLTAGHLKALLRAPFDAAAWHAASSPHLHLRIGNQPPAVGRDAALDALADLLSRVDEIGCMFFESWQRKETIYVEADACFIDHSGSARVLPCAVVARCQDGRLMDLRLYLDAGPVQ